MSGVSHPEEVLWRPARQDSAASLNVTACACAPERLLFFAPLTRMGARRGAGILMRNSPHAGARPAGAISVPGGIRAGAVAPQSIRLNRCRNGPLSTA